MSPSATPSPLLTAAEFMTRYEKHRAELVRGVVKFFPPGGFRHGVICARLCGIFGNHIDGHDLGHAMSNDTWVWTTADPDSIRCGDLLFYGYDRLPRGRVPDGIVPTSPDMVIEVRSPSDLWGDLSAKVEEYLGAGVRVVIVLDPTKAAISVHRPRQEQSILQTGDTLTVPDVLPGFAVEVEKLIK